MQANTELKQQTAADITPVYPATETEPAYAGPNAQGLWFTDRIGTDEMTYAELEKAVKECRAGGFDDWRIPTLHEQFGEVDHTKFNPATDANKYPNITGGWYWTSTECAWSKDEKGVASLFWVVNFSYGDVLDSRRSYNAFARAVRGGGAPASQ